MKKFLTFLCAVMLVLGMVGSASAVPYLDLNGDHTGSVWMGEWTNSSETWIFDLDNDTLSIGDINAGDTINSAFLSIGILDNDPADNREWKLEFADLSLDGTSIYNDVEVDTGIFTINVISWVADHQLNVTIDDVHNDPSWSAGNFLVTGVSVEGDYDAAAPVPEPSTILLMGIGLLGLVGYSRKRKKS